MKVLLTNVSKKIAGPDGIQLLCALVERTQFSPDGVDAQQFRIDYKDRREKNRELAKAGFIATIWEPLERYRPTLIALSLIDSNSARSLLALVDRLLRYLVLQYEAERDQQLSVAQISADLKVPFDTIREALGYLIDTPVVGPRTIGFPDSENWWLTLVEQSLDYPNLDALLLQLAEWSTHSDPTTVHNAVPITAPYPPQSALLPMTRYDRLANRIKNHKVLAGLTVAMSAIIFLAAVLAGLTGQELCVETPQEAFPGRSRRWVSHSWTVAALDLGTGGLQWRWLPA